MRHLLPIVAAALILSACGHVNASRYDKAGKYTVCKCEGKERQPTPSEAEGVPDDERVDVVCEGKVTACHPGSLRNPLRPSEKAID
ncbi:MAG: hypothetical protein U0270_05830 [Labilithrix sp.]